MRLEILGLCFTTADSGLSFSHDPWLVALSFVTAVFASFVALDMTERLRGMAGPQRWAWHAGASLVLGGGIWAMHFIGMIAFTVDAPFGFAPGLTALSLLVAVLVVAIGLWLVRAGMGLKKLLPAGLIVGIGVVCMHYAGMAALTLPGEVAYRPGIFGLSVMIALVAATTALALAFMLRRATHRLLAAIVMGVAVCGMHYVGMEAMVITLDPTAPMSDDSMSKPLLALGVAACTYGLLFLALLASIADRRINAAAAREAARLRQANQALEQEIAVRRKVEAELEQTRQALEIRVVERTRDLEEARSRAEAASSAKSEFLASMSHELRTPLNSIMGFAQLLLFNRAREPLTVKQERAAMQIEKAGTHLLRLIDEVLDLARVEAGRLTLSLEPVDAAGLIGDVVTAMQPVAQEAGITLVVQNGGPRHVIADRTRLQQVLTNLTSNAIKYNRSNGSVTLSIEAQGDRVRIGVRDTGIGIPADRLAQLYQPFNRLGREHGAVEGTGIGLTICKRLLHAMDSDMEVESAEGQGTLFHFDLPAAAATAVAPSLSSLQKACAERPACTMLYVEDNPANIQLLRDLVDAMGGIDLLVAADPGSGLQLARAHRPDVIVLDINLPGMDGFEVLARLKADPVTAATPVLALSANAMPREVERGLAAGFLRYLTKPLRVSEFIAALDVALGRAAA